MPTKGVRGEELAEILLEMSDELEGKFRREFLRQIELLSGSKILKQLLEDIETGAYESGDPIDVRLNRISIDTSTLDEIMRNAIARSARITKETVGLQGAFNVTNPEVINAARNLSVQLSTNLNTTARQTIRDIIQDAVEGNITRVEAANRIKRLVGLIPQHAQAVDKYLNRMLADGMKKSLAKQRADKYAERLLRYRANTIARTEIARSVGTGQTEYWKQMRSEGFLPPEARRVWITASDEKVCAICGPMNGVVADIDGFFDTSAGPSEYPQASHPNCRCTAGITMVTPKKRALVKKEDELALALWLLAKANPYKDARGRFTTKAKAVAPKGKHNSSKIKTASTRDSDYYSHSGYKSLPEPTDDLEVARTTGAPIRWLMPQSMAEPLAKLYDEYVLRRSDTRSPNPPDPADFHNALIVQLANLGVVGSYERRIIADGILRRANFHAKERVEFSLDANQQIIDQALGGVAEIPRWDKQTKEGVFGEIGDEFVGIHIHNENLRKVMDDGRYKTQFESGISGGMLDTDRRAMQEVAMFSLHPSLSGEKRPVYGQIYTDGFSMDSWREAGQYGQTVLVLKKSNHERTSYTSGDSLGRTVQSSSMKTPSFHGGDKKELGGTDMFGGSDLAYIEAQIHGGVKVSDISHIIIPSDGGVGPDGFRKKYNIPSSIKIINIMRLQDGDKIHKALVSNVPADAILSATSGNTKLYVSLKNKDVGYVETEEGLAYKVNPHDVFARGYWKPYTLRDRLKKANPYKDARGRFTTKAKAVAPKGKGEKSKKKSTVKVEPLTPYHTVKVETFSPRKISPSALVRYIPVSMRNAHYPEEVEGTLWEHQSEIDNLGDAEPYPSGHKMTKHQKDCVDIISYSWINNFERGKYIRAKATRLIEDGEVENYSSHQQPKNTVIGDDILVATTIQAIREAPKSVVWRGLRLTEEAASKLVKGAIHEEAIATGTGRKALAVQFTFGRWMNPQEASSKPVQVLLKIKARNVPIGESPVNTPKQVKALVDDLLFGSGGTQPLVAFADERFISGRYKITNEPTKNFDGLLVVEMEEIG